MADAYSYIKMSNAYPSAGGIAMILEKAYGQTTVAAGASLLMALSMVINESLVARTFGTYTPRAFGGDNDSVLVPVLGVGLIVLAYLVTASGTRSVGLVSIVMAVLKVGGIALSRMLAMLTAVVFDAVVLAAFAAMKWQSDPPIVVIGLIGMALVFLFVRVFLARNLVSEGDHDHHRK